MINIKKSSTNEEKYIDLDDKESVQDADGDFSFDSLDEDSDSSYTTDSEQDKKVDGEENGEVDTNLVDEDVVNIKEDGK